MRREDEIKQVAFEFAFKVNSIRPELNADSFIQGAKWADETMIEKACEWIEMNAIKYVNSIGGCMYFDVINSTKDFKKALEL